MNYEVFVIRDDNSGLYFSCITEHCSIFLSNTFETIETYTNKADALQYLAWILDVRHPRFLNDERGTTLSTPKWTVGKLKVSFEFEKDKNE
jgi:hypothetical protein